MKVAVIPGVKDFVAFATSVGLRQAVESGSTVEASSMMPAVFDAPHGAAPSARLRLCSDDQLVGRFRAGRDEAFEVIHDRYRMRLLAYVRQMLSGRSTEDAEDVLQEVFERAAQALRSEGPPVGLRAWLYSVAHNRCIDELRRRPPATPDVFAASRQPPSDTSAVAERRADVQRLFDDLRGLPEVQRSALLMRELQGLSHAELAHVLDASVPAVKSLLVRARGGLVDAAEARGTACATIRDDLAATHDRRVKTSARAARHLLECPPCRSYRAELRRTTRRVAALAPAPALFPLAALGRLLGGAGVPAKAPVTATGFAGTGGVFAGAGKLFALLGATTALTTGAVLERNGALPWASPSPGHHAAPAVSDHGAALAAGATLSRSARKATSAGRLAALQAPAGAGAVRPTATGGAVSGTGRRAPGEAAAPGLPGAPATGQVAAGETPAALPAPAATAPSTGAPAPTPANATGSAQPAAASAPADDAAGSGGQASAPAGHSLVGTVLAAPAAVTQAAAGAASRLFSGAATSGSGSSSDGSGSPASGSGGSGGAGSGGSGSASGSGSGSGAGPGAAGSAATPAHATGPIATVVGKVAAGLR
jgi:RNA polymerase sigma factor (sigma-70 family)